MAGHDAQDLLAQAAQQAKYIEVENAATAKKVELAAANADQLRKEFAADRFRLSNAQMRLHYGNEAVAASREEELAKELRWETATRGRTPDEFFSDNRLSVLKGAAGLTVGLPLLAADLLTSENIPEGMLGPSAALGKLSRATNFREEVLTPATQLYGKFNEWIEENSSDVVRADNEIKAEQNAEAELETQKLFDYESSQGNEVVAGLRKVGRDLGHDAVNLVKHPTAFTNTVVEQIPSFGLGFVAKGLVKNEAVMARSDTLALQAEAKAYRAGFKEEVFTADAFKAKARNELETRAFVGLVAATETGSVYGDAAGQIMEMDFEEIRERFPNHPDIIAIDRTGPDQVDRETEYRIKQKLASEIALKASAMMLPIAAGAARFAAALNLNPLGLGKQGIRQKAGQEILDVLGEPIEEGLQGAGGELVKNIARIEAGDDQQRILQGVGGAAGEGIAVAGAMAAGLRAPSVALAGAGALGKMALEPIAARGRRIQETFAADLAVVRAENAAKIQTSADSLSTGLQTIPGIADSLLVPLQADPTVEPGITAQLQGTTAVPINKVQALSRAIAMFPTLKDEQRASMGIFAYKTAREIIDNMATMPIELREAAFRLVNNPEVRELVAQVQTMPLEVVEELIATLPVGRTPDGIPLSQAESVALDKVKVLLDLAPDKFTRAQTERVLAHEDELTPAQKKQLELAAKIDDVREDKEKVAAIIREQFPNAKGSSQVRLEIEDTGFDTGKSKKLSLSQYVRRISTFMANGNVQLAKIDMVNLQRFADHMRRRSDEFDTAAAHQVAKGSNKGDFQTVALGGTIDADGKLDLKTQYKLDITNEGSLETLSWVFADANTVAETYNLLAKQFPEIVRASKNDQGDQVLDTQADTNLAPAWQKVASAEEATAYLAEKKAKAEAAKTGKKAPAATETKPAEPVATPTAVEAAPANVIELPISAITRRNGEIGNQGVTEDQVRGILTNVLGMVVDAKATMREMVEAFKANPAMIAKLREFTVKNPLTATQLPDDSFSIHDGHHRAFLLQQAGETTIPAIVADYRGNAKPAASTSDNGYVTTTQGNQVRVSIGQPKTNMHGGENAVTLEIRSGPGDTESLIMVVGKDGKLITSREASNADDTVSDQVWNTGTPEQQKAVVDLLRQRADTKIGSSERKALEAKIVDIVTQESGSGTTTVKNLNGVPAVKTAAKKAEPAPIVTPVDNAPVQKTSETGFTPKNEEQRIGIEKIQAFLADPGAGTIFVLEGKAGTGKTAIMQEALHKEIKAGRSVTISAVSHKAKAVLNIKLMEMAKRMRYTGSIVAKTIAGLLGMKMNKNSAKKDFLFDEQDVRFAAISRANIIIVDEASMIDQVTFDRIMKYKKPGAKVIFLGDIGQLAPIENLDGKISPVFTKDLPRYKLLERVRQGEDSTILPYADFYWDNGQQGDNAEFNPIPDEARRNSGELKFVTTMEEAIANYIPLFRKAITDRVTNLVRIVAYNNKTKDTQGAAELRKFESDLRKTLFGPTPAVFEIGEQVIMNEPFSLDTGEEEPTLIENSREFVVTAAEEKESIEILDSEGNPVKFLQPIPPGSPVGTKAKEIVFNLSGFNVTVYDDLEKTSYTLPVLSQKPEVQKDWKKFLSMWYDSIKNIKESGKGERNRALYIKELAAWWAAKDKFAELSYSYIITAHKSQGSTYQNVIVWEDNIMDARAESSANKSRALYTAITRASNEVTIVSALNTEADQAPPASAAAADKPKVVLSTPSGIRDLVDQAINGRVKLDIGTINKLSQNILNLLGLNDVKLKVKYIEASNETGIGLASFERNDQGDWTGGVTISLRSTLRGAELINVLSHEIGHVIEKHFLYTADAATQDAVRAAFESWVEGHKKAGTLKSDILKSRQPAAFQGLYDQLYPEAKGPLATEILANPAERSMLFTEWFADNAARYLTTDAVAVGLVETFFKAIATKLRELLGLLQGKALPDQAIKNYIDSLRNAAANPDDGVVEAAGMQEEEEEEEEEQERTQEVIKADIVRLEALQKNRKFLKDNPEALEKEAEDTNQDPDKLWVTVNRNYEAGESRLEALRNELANFGKATPNQAAPEVAAAIEALEEEEAETTTEEVIEDPQSMAEAFPGLTANLGSEPAADLTPTQRYERENKFLSGFNLSKKSRSLFRRISNTMNTVLTAIQETYTQNSSAPLMKLFVPEHQFVRPNDLQIGALREVMAGFVPDIIDRLNADLLQRVLKKGPTTMSIAEMLADPTTAESEFLKRQEDRLAKNPNLDVQPFTLEWQNANRLSLHTVTWGLDKNGKFFIKYQPEIAEAMALAAINWSVSTINNPIIPDREKLLKMYPNGFSEDLASAHARGYVFTQPVRSIAADITQILGITAKSDLSVTFSDGLPKALAQDALHALEMIGVIKFEEHEGTELANIDKDGKEFFKKIRFLMFNKEAKDNNWNNKGEAKSLKLVADHLGGASLLTRLLLPDTQELPTFGEPSAVVPTRTSGTYQNLSKQQRTGIRKANNSRFYANIPFLELFDIVGEEKYLTLMGKTNLDQDGLNEAHRRRLEGINQGLSHAVKGMTEMRALWADKAKQLGQDIKNVPAFFSRRIISNGRMMMNPSLSPQANKFIREMVSAVKQTLDMKNPMHEMAYYLTLAQALGIKTELTKNQNAVDQVKAILASPVYRAVLEEMHTMTQMEEGADRDVQVELVMDTVSFLMSDENTAVHKPPRTDRAFHALATHARFLAQENRDSFETYLAFELDGKTDGPFNAITHFGFWAANPLKAIEQLRKGGWFINEQGILTLSDDTDTKDLYNDIASLAQKRIGEEISLLSASTDKRDIRKLARLNASITLLAKIKHFKVESVPKSKDYPTGTKLTILRQHAKNALMTMLYGAGKHTVNSVMAYEILDYINEQMSNSLRDKSGALRPEDQEAMIALMSAYRNPDRSEGAPKWIYITPPQMSNVSKYGKGMFNSDHIRALIDNLGASAGGILTSSVASEMQDVLSTFDLLYKATAFQSWSLKQNFEAAAEALRLQRVKEGKLGTKDALSEADERQIIQDFAAQVPAFATMVAGSNLEGEGVNVIEKDYNGQVIIGNQVQSAGSLFGNLKVDINAAMIMNPGVRAAALLIIAAGDGSMMTRLQGNNPDGTLDVYDGWEVGPLELAARAMEVNKVVYENAQFDLLGSVLKTFEGTALDINSLNVDEVTDLYLYMGLKIGKDDNVNTMRGKLNQMFSKTRNTLQYRAESTVANKKIAKTLRNGMDHMSGWNMQSFTVENPIQFALLPYYKAERKALLGDKTEEQLEDQEGDELQGLIPAAATEEDVIETATENSAPKDFTNHSGGALGADSMFSTIGKALGFIKHNHYYHGQKTPTGNVALTDAQITEGIKHAKAAAKVLGRSWNNAFASLLGRNWFQVKNATQVIAIAPLIKRGDKNSKGYVSNAARTTVDGGTGYAVEMAIANGKKVHVFDTATNQWYEWKDGDFVVSEVPVLDLNYAGIGSRQDNGKMTPESVQAIRDVYEKTLNSLAKKKPEAATPVSGVKKFTRSELFALLRDRGFSNPIREFVFKKIIHLLPENLTVYFGTKEEMLAKSYEVFPDKPAGFFSETSRAWFFKGTVFMTNTNEESLIHELVHAATYQTLLTFYNNEAKGLSFAQKEGIRALEILAYKFAVMNIPTELSEEVQNDFSKAQLVVRQLLRNGDTAEGVNEFMAWTMTNTNVQSVLTQTAGITALKVLRNIAKKIVKLVREILDLPNNPTMETFMEQALSSFERLVRQPNSSLDVSNVDIPLNHAMGSPPATGLQGLRLQELADQFEWMRMHLPKDGRSALKIATRAIDALPKADHIRQKFVDAGFSFTAQEQFVFEQLQALFASTITLDAGSLIGLQNIYNEVMPQLTAEDFLDDPLNNGQIQMNEATARFNALKGVGTLTKDKLGRSNDLANFVALALVHVPLRTKMSNMVAAKEKVEGKNMDQKIRSFTTIMFNKLNDVATLHNKAQNQRQAIDLLIARLYNNQQIAVKRAGLAPSMFEQVEGKVKEGISFLADKANDTLQARTAAGQMGGVDGIVNFGLNAVRAMGSEAGSAAFAEGAQQAINESGIWRPIAEILGDIVGLTDSSYPIALHLNQVKNIVSRARQRMRDEIPPQVRALFATPLSPEAWKTLHRVVGEIDLRAIFGAFSGSDLQGLLRDPGQLTAAADAIEGQLGSQALVYAQAAKDLAHYQTTGTNIAQGFLWRNPEAMALMAGTGIQISSAEFQRLVPLLDRLTTLRALEGLQEAERVFLADLIQDNKLGMDSLLRLMKSINAAEFKKPDYKKQALNRWKGYLPKSFDPRDVLVLANPTQGAELIKQGYRRLEAYQGDPLDPGASNLHYYAVTWSGGKSAYNQGAMQTVEGSVSGVDRLTGRTLNSSVQTMITDQVTVQAITDAKRLGGSTGQHNLLPVFDAKGEVYAYERVLDRALLERHQTGHVDLSESIGMWMGRQVEEDIARIANKKLTQVLKKIWDKGVAAGRRGEFVNIADAKTKALQEAWGAIPRETQDMLHDTFGDEVMVRNDMLNSALGNRSASVADVFTGLADLPVGTQKFIVDAAYGLLGKDAYKRLVVLERTWQDIVGLAKNIIIVRSGTLALANGIANQFQLVAMGVPPNRLLQDQIAKAREAEIYFRNEKQLAELEFKKATANRPDVLSEVNRQIRVLRDINTKLSIWPLIEAGELSTISEGLNEQDEYTILNDFVKLLEDKTKNLPAGLTTAAKYLMISKDTAIYQGLNRAIQLGDFMAKAVSYDLFISQGMSQKQALKKVNESFVNYNLPLGRGHDYAENMGMLWFSKYTIRIQKIIMRTIRDNPLRFLMAGVGADWAGADYLTESSLAMKSWGWSVGPGQVFRASDALMWRQINPL